MTKKEALIATLRAPDVPDDTLEKALTDHDINGAATYTAADAEPIDRTAVDILIGILTDPDISEGGFSKRYDRKAVLDRVLFLARKWGWTDIIDEYTVKPTVKGVRVW